MSVSLTDGRRKGNASLPVISFEGIKFPSHKMFCEHYGISYRQAEAALDKQEWPITDKKPKRKKGYGVPVPCFWKGKHFPTLAEAARWEGVIYTTFIYRYSKWEAVKRKDVH